MSLQLEDEVREALHSRAAHLMNPWGAYERVMEAVATRRRRARMAWAGVASLALAGVIGVAAGLGDEPSHVGTPAPEELSPQITRWGPPFSWPARGDLGSDPTFADEFGRHLGADHHLIYAEDGDAGRVVVAVASAEEVVVFHGLRGASLDELERVPGLPVNGRDVVVALQRGDDHLVIILMPSHINDAQISPPDVARDGSIERTWLQVPVEEGVARVVTSGPITALRVRTPEGDGPPDVVAGEGDEPPGNLRCGLCDGAWFAAEGLSAFRSQAAAVVGDDVDDVTARLIVDVAIPLLPSARDEVSPGRIVTYVATLPSGGLLRATYLVTGTPGNAEAAMVEPLRPLPAGDGDRPVFIPAQIVGSALIVAPGASRISFEPLHRAAALTEVILTGGVGVVGESPRNLSGYSVTSYGTDGGVERTWHGTVLDTDDPFQVFGRG